MNKAMSLPASLGAGLAGVTEVAAIAAQAMTGRGDKEGADQLAVDAMRDALNALPMRGRIVIGEGERDEAPMLYIGEEVGLRSADMPEIDIALDPLEGTTPAAKGMPNALAVVAIAPKGGLLHAPDTYMDKIAIGPGLPQGVVDLDMSSADNARSLAEAKGVDVSDITVCVLDRDRHQDIVDGLRDVGARISFITDGDVQGVLATTDPATGIDMYIGRGGAPEGVLAAAALLCVGGQMQGRLHFRNEDEVARARRTGLDDLEKKYDLQGLASGPCVFSATGVTGGSLLDGVRVERDWVHTQTLLMNSADASVRRIRAMRAR